MACKECFTCKKSLPRHHFWDDKKNPDGKYYECKPCARDRNNSWYRANSEKIQEKSLAQVHSYRKRRGWLKGVLASAKCRCKKPEWPSILQKPILWSRTSARCWGFP